MTAFRREDALRARLSGFRRMVEQAEREVAEAIAEHRGTAGAAVAWSGGKDSLVCLDLLARAGGGAALYSDDELIEPGGEWYARETAEDLGLRYRHVLGWARHGGWFDPWRQAPYWRPMPEAEHIGGLIEPWQLAQGYSPVILGLRGQEAIRRRHNARRGTTYVVADGGVRCQPLRNWKIGDVWAYLADRGLEPNPWYARMTAAGIPRDMQRVGPLPMAPRWVLAQTDLMLLRKLEERYGRRWS
jgi:phosphoadenosine phosphosulfate reductase